MSVQVAAEGWMATALRADSTVMSLVEDVYSETVPRGTSGNVITWDYQGGEDEETFNNIRVATRVTYIVTVVGIGTLEDLDPIEAAMDHVLHKGQGTHNGYRIGACVRTAPYT